MHLCKLYFEHSNVEGRGARWHSDRFAKRLALQTMYSYRRLRLMGACLVQDIMYAVIKLLCAQSAGGRGHVCRCSSSATCVSLLLGSAYEYRSPFYLTEPFRSLVVETLTELKSKVYIYSISHFSQSKKNPRHTRLHTFATRTQDVPACACAAAASRIRGERFTTRAHSRLPRRRRTPPRAAAPAPALAPARLLPSECPRLSALS